MGVSPFYFFYIFIYLYNYNTSNLYIMSKYIIKDKINYIIDDKSYWTEHKLIDDIKSNMINLAESIKEVNERQINLSLKVSFPGNNRIDTIIFNKINDISIDIEESNRLNK